MAKWDGECFGALITAERDGYFGPFGAGGRGRLEAGGWRLEDGTGEVGSGVFSWRLAVDG
jgi:hypothetical protein